MSYLMWRTAAEEPAGALGNKGCPWDGEDDPYDEVGHIGGLRRRLRAAGLPLSLDAENSALHIMSVKTFF